MRVAVALLILLISATASGAPLKGGKSSMRWQNILADRYRMERAKNLKDLKRLIAKNKLVGIPDGNAHYFLNEHLGELDAPNREYYKHARAYTRNFVLEFSGLFYARFGKKIMVTSLVRTEEYQKRLRRAGNPNAAPVRGGLRSAHLTGSVVDISFKDLSDDEISWISGWLKSAMKKNRLYAIKESRGGCFHIMVLPSYSKPTPKSKRR